MDTSVLVENWIEQGERVVEALARSHLPINAALWLYFPEAGDWRLVIASSWYDTKGSWKAYSRIGTVLESLSPASSIKLRDTTVRSPTDSLVQALRSAEASGVGVVGRRLGGVSLGDVFLDGAYVYRLEPDTYPRVELTRRALSISEAGASDDWSWNCCVLAGLFGVPVAQVQAMPVPDPLMPASLDQLLANAQGQGLIDRWKRDPAPTPWPGAAPYLESSRTWAYRMDNWLRKGFFPLILPENGRVWLLCGVREERQEHQPVHDQVLISSPVAVEEWVATSTFLRRFRRSRTGEVFVKPSQP